MRRNCVNVIVDCSVSSSYCRDVYGDYSVSSSYGREVFMVCMWEKITKIFVLDNIYYSVTSIDQF